MKTKDKLAPGNGKRAPRKRPRDDSDDELESTIFRAGQRGTERIIDSPEITPRPPRPPAGDSFPCPFFAHDPGKFKEVKTCCGPGWTDVHRVKEHIYRKHSSRNTCPRCGVRFPSESEFRLHQRAPTPCQPVETYPDVITEEQEKQLHVRARSNSSQIEKWLNVYRIIFPGEPSPWPFRDVDRTNFSPSEGPPNGVVDAANDDPSMSDVGLDFDPILKESGVIDLDALFGESGKFEFESFLRAPSESDHESDGAYFTNEQFPDYPQSAYNYGTWTAVEDKTLMSARGQGHHWSSIQRTHFPSKTANACRKRHERLMERRGILTYNPTDFYSKLLQNHANTTPSHRIVTSEEGERLLGAGATWDLIINHDMFKRGLVNIEDITARLKRQVKTDGQGHVWEERVILEAIEQSVFPDGLIEIQEPYRDVAKAHEGRTQAEDVRSTLSDTSEANRQHTAPPLYAPTDYHDSGYGSMATKSVAPGSKLTGTQELDQNVAISHEEEAQETRTVFSDAASLLQHPDIDKYISAFSRELAHFIPLELVNPGETDKLDHLLRAFAVRLGYETSGRAQKQLMYLVYRFRSDIIKRLQRILQAQNDDLESVAGTIGSDDVSSTDINPGMTLDEKMRLLLNRESSNPCDTQDIDHAALDSLNDIDDFDGFDESAIPELSRYREILSEAPSYQWLQSTIRVHSALQVPGLDPPSQVGEQIIKLASGNQTRKMFSRKESQELSMHFSMDWDLPLFAEEQQYDDAPPLSRVLAQTITLTGHGNNLQAVTCERYLEQTWPETGLQLLGLLQRAADTCGGSGASEVLLRDKTRLTARFSNCQLEFDAAGNVFSVAEIAEQLSWMGAALRSSPSEEEAAYSTPHITELTVDHNSTSSAPNRVTTTGFCEIGFKMDILRDSDLAKSGKCWRGMFGNPVIVRGYPIPSRTDTETDTGLEIPLNIASALTSCRRVVNFAGITYLKGFAAMLAAVRVVGNVVFWHLCYNPDGRYISYEDTRISRLSAESKTLSMDTLEGSRHIIGWSDNVRNHVGAPEANYDIEWTELPSPNSTHVLEKVTLSGSAVPFISPGASFVIGVKDKPLHLGFGKDDDYMGNLFTVGKRYFVFYDSEDKRAWLVDGVSTVLHLLRAYLKFYAEDDRISDYFMFSEGDLEEAQPGAAYTGTKAAYDVLTNPKNQNLPLYPKKSNEKLEERITKLGNDVDVTILKKTTSSNFTLKDRVEQICHILLQTTAYHDDMNTQAGYGFRIKSSPRHQLEGFEFMDIATRHDSLWPKVATIQAMSVGWVHLARSLHAVPLFGAGFGDLFRPVRKGPAQNEPPPQGCCSPTTSMPSGKDFLAVYGADLKDMVRMGGSKRRNPWRLTGNVHWHSPDGVAFESCRCHQDSNVLMQQQEDETKQATADINSQTQTANERKGLGFGRRMLAMFSGKYDTANKDTSKPTAQPPKPSTPSLPTPDKRVKVQVLLPATFPQLYGRGLRSPAQIVPTGAVIFGHSWKFPLRWSLTKDIPPVEGEPDPAASLDEVCGQMYDSGIGTSVDSSSDSLSGRPAASASSRSLYELGTTTDGGSDVGFNSQSQDSSSRGGGLSRNLKRSLESLHGPDGGWGSAPKMRRVEGSAGASSFKRDEADDV